jgi:hypothetical protein
MMKVLSLMVLAFVVCATSFAGPVLYTGSTTGFFTSSPGSGDNLGSSVFGLSYTGSTFSCITDPINNRCDIGNTNGNVDNLGLLSLAFPPSANYNGLGFVLTVTFTAPPGTSPNPATYTGSLSGTVFAANQGGVGITWTGNGPQHNGAVPLPPFHTPASAGGAGFIQFSTTSTGPFVLHVNPTNVATPDVSGGTRVVPVTGHIHDTPQGQIPEPSTMGLMGSGLLLAVAGWRRRVRS